MGRRWLDNPSPSNIAHIRADWDAVDWLDQCIEAHPSSSWQRDTTCTSTASALHEPGAGTVSTPDGRSNPGTG